MCIRDRWCAVKWSTELKGAVESGYHHSPSYAPATPCPVLRAGMMLRGCYAMSSAENRTEAGYGGARRLLEDLRGRIEEALLLLNASPEVASSYGHVLRHVRVSERAEKALSASADAFVCAARRAADAVEEHVWEGSSAGLVTCYGEEWVDSTALEQTVYTLLERVTWVECAVLGAEEAKGGGGVSRAAARTPTRGKSVERAGEGEGERERGGQAEVVGRFWTRRIVAGLTRRWRYQSGGGAAGGGAGGGGDWAEQAGTSALHQDPRDMRCGAVRLRGGVLERLERRARRGGEEGGKREVLRRVKAVLESQGAAEVSSLVRAISLRPRYAMSGTDLAYAGRGAR
eukprot:1347767-Rhodomonas_salina.1